MQIDTMTAYWRSLLLVMSVLGGVNLIKIYCDLCPCLLWAFKFKLDKFNTLLSLLLMVLLAVVTVFATMMILVVK